MFEIIDQPTQCGANIKVIGVGGCGGSPRGSGSSGEGLRGAADAHPDGQRILHGPRVDPLPHERRPVTPGPGSTHHPGPATPEQRPRVRTHRYVPSSR